MGLALQTACRSLLGRPGRTFFSILGVAVGIATVVGVFTIDHVSVLDRTRRFSGDFGADLEVRPRRGLFDPRGELLALKGVAGVAAFFQNDVRFRPVIDGVKRQGDDEFRAVRLVALEAASAPGLGAYRVERGRGLEPGARGVLLGQGLAEAFALEPGDRCVLSPPARSARSACIDGVLQNVGEGESLAREDVFLVAGILAREGLGRSSRSEVCIVDYDVGLGLFEGAHVESRYWLRRENEVDLEELEAGLGRDFTFERNQRKAVGQMADERAFRNGVRLAGLFALLLGLFVIFHTLSMSLLERVREVGTLHSLGATRSQIARVFFVEACFIAGSAGALGIGGGLAFARGMLLLGISTLGVGKPIVFFEVPWRVVLLLTGLGVAIALVGSVYPILRARGVDFVAALRGEDLGSRRSVAQGFQGMVVILLVAIVPALFFLVVPVVGALDPALIRTLLLGLVVLAVAIGLPLLRPTLAARLCGLWTEAWRGRFPLAGELSTGSMAQNPSRTASAVAAIGIVTAAFVGLKGMTNSLQAEIEVWGEGAVRDKLFVRGLPDVALERLAADLDEAGGVLGFEPVECRVYAHSLLLGLRSEHLAGYGPLARDPALRQRLEEEQGVILSRRLARQRELSVGDVMLVNTTGHGVQEFPVVAVSDEYGYFVQPDERAYAVTSDRHLERFFCIDTKTVRDVSIQLVRGGDPGELSAFLRQRYPGARLGLTSGQGVLDYHLGDIDRDFVVFDIILLLTALLAGLGVLNGQLLAVLERRKEFGVLHALGMTGGQTAGTVLLESSAVGLVGGSLGLLLGSALVPVLVGSLRTLSGLELPVRGAGVYLPLALAGATALSLAAGLYPLWRMKRMDVVRAVRTG